MDATVIKTAITVVVCIFIMLMSIEAYTSVKRIRSIDDLLIKSFENQRMLKHLLNRVWNITIIIVLLIIIITITWLS